MTSSTGTVVFNDAKLQAIDVVATERLGVGTLDPTSNLHVVGNVHVTGNVNKLNFTDGYTIKRGANVTVFGTTDVIQEITGPHARDVVPLRKYPEVAFAEGKFDTTDNEIVSTYWAGHSTVFQGGYSVKTSHHSTDDGGQYGWHVFDDNPETIWKNAEDYNSSTGNYDYGFTNVQSRLTDTNSTNHDGDHVIMGSPSKLKIVKVSVTCKSSIRRVVNYSVLGSNSTGTTGWTLLDSGSFAAQDANIATITSPTTHFKYHAFVVRSVTAGVNGQRFQINSIHYYGYDEDVGAGDDSVDVTFKSVYNSPDLTNAALYIDGDKGSTPTDFSGEGHALTDNSESFSGNAWSFTSLSTSNVTMSTGDLAMEGTHPHSVSLWFNAANVSSNATLFHVGTAAGEGDAKTSISLTESGHLGWIDGGDNQFLSANTWHNLVYATQGGGGVRTCYLDGRKLGDAQVQDTFGDYPPFAMSSYSQYGYVVSSNSENSVNPAWEAFDSIEYGAANGEGWETAAQTYRQSGDFEAISGGSGGSTVDTITDTNSGQHTGYWIKIEFPQRIRIDYARLQAQNSLNQPKSYVHLFSNNDQDWDLGYTHTTGDWSQAGIDLRKDVINTTKYYKYAMILVKSIRSTGGTCRLHEIGYYGHKENDTTRFPVSSTVLKYPHVAMTGPAQRGYVVEGSSRINYTDVEYEPWKSFGWSTPGTQSPYDAGWVSLNTSYSTSSPYNANSNESLSGIDGVGSRNGAYLTVTFPRKLAITKFDIYSRSATTDARVTEGYIYGSQDKTTWYEIAQISVDSTNLASYTNTTPCVITTDSTTAYRYAAIQATSVGNSAGYISYGKIELYGTEPEDVIARVGEGLDGKVANFRVYDKYLHEEQALELWDSQKDQFGRAESSVVVHKGRLGVGTTEPEGRFAVLDEPGDMEEFPPRAMTDYETYMEGHGVFKASADRERNTYESWRAFDKSVDFFDNILDLNGNNADQYEESSGDYIGSATTTTLDAGQIDGSWIQLQIPYKVKLSSFALAPQPKGAIAHFYGASRMPKTGSIVGSNDGVNWYLIGSITKDEYGAGLAHFSMNSTSFYSYFRLIAQTITAGDFSIYRNRLALSQFNLFGTREQGQSTLHDGSLTLTKNLTVPRIGPPLDADDTPRRDRLVVEYNTSTNPTANGTVKDTSGRGNDGLFYGGASYDATEKVLDTPNSTGIIGKNINLPGGNIPLSVSAWFRLIDTTTVTNDTIVCLGTNSTATGGGSFILRVNTDQLRINFEQSSNYTEFTKTISNRIWYHVVATYDGGTSASGRKLFIDGVEIAQTSTSGTITGVNLPVNPGFTVGMRTSINGYLNGSISQFKLYDTALTADEVKRLYDMGRCDEGHHVVNFSKTRVGIGLGDGEAPRADLDVRDGARFGGRVGIGNQPENADDGNAYPGTFPASSIHIHQNNTVGEDTESEGIRFSHPANVGRWNLFVSSNNHFRIAYNGVSRGYVDQNDNNAQMNFTGQHRTFIKDTPFTRAEELEGLIVSADNNKYIKMSGGIEAGSNAITTNESLPVVSLSTKVNDKKCFGVISASEDPEQRSDAYGSFVTPFEKELGDTRVYINSVGEGAMWVVNTAGALESGDYITTSNVAGYGQKQESDSLKNYTVAKITMDCDFNPQDQPIQRIKQSNVVETHYTGLVPVVKGVPHEFVTTTVTADDEWSNVSVSPPDVTYAEWSNLEANTQNTYTLTYTQTSNVVYDVKYTKTTTANVTAEDAWDAVHIDGKPTVTYAEYSNLEANVQNTYTLTYTMTTKVEATEAIYSNLSTEDKTLFIPTYYQMVEQTVDAEYPGAVKHETVTNRLENALDEHGQLQWEDDPSGAMEKAYKIRYLDASGQQTDEANCVHRAAFVGCTYHCG